MTGVQTCALPILRELTSTPNSKLDELQQAFLEQGGECYTGPEAWEHLVNLAGATMSLFLEKYVRRPIDSLITEAPLNLPEFVASMTDGNISIRIGEEVLNITREAIEIEDNSHDEAPDDADHNIPG